MSIRFAALLTLLTAPAFCQDWNARLAAQYMDSRQKEWAAWPNALVLGCSVRILPHRAAIPGLAPGPQALARREVRAHAV